MGEPMQDALTPSDIATFRNDGVVCLRGVLSSAWLDRLADGVEENLKSPGPMAVVYTDDGRTGRYFGDYCNWQRIPALRETAFSSPLAAIAGVLIGASRVQLFHEHVLVKEPGTAEVTPWHHDQPYYVAEGEQTASIWVPLDRVEASVCPRFLAGSHLTRELYVPRLFKTGAPFDGSSGRYRPLEDIDEAAERDRLRFWSLAPGDVLVFHFRTLHNAPANLSRNRRRVVSFRFLGDDVRYVERPHKPSPPYRDMGLDTGRANVCPRTGSLSCGRPEETTARPAAICRRRAFFAWRVCDRPPSHRSPRSSLAGRSQGSSPSKSP